MVTTLLQEMKAAEAKFEAEEGVDHLDALEAAERAYFGAIQAKREIWEAIPEGADKDDAEINANETEGTREDRLFWFEVAIETYKLTQDYR